jgi:hypothetical protein
VEGVAFELMPELSSATSLHLKGVTSGLKVVFFFPLLPRDDIIEVMEQTPFSLKEGVKLKKRGVGQ